MIPEKVDIWQHMWFRICTTWPDWNLSKST